MELITLQTITAEYSHGALEKLGKRRIRRWMIKSILYYGILSRPLRHSVSTVQLWREYQNNILIMIPDKIIKAHVAMTKHGGSVLKTNIQTVVFNGKRWKEPFAYKI